MEWALGIFQHRVVRWITGKKTRRWREGGWEYPPLTSDMEEAGFEKIRVYILKRQNRISQYIATQPILYLCEQSVQRPGAWISWRWWEQEGLDLAWAREQAVAATDREDERSGEDSEKEETACRS